jgi:uncharacterized protein with von Willebrand factor type A (vWA) domain
MMNMASLYDEKKNNIEIQIKNLFEMFNEIVIERDIFKKKLQETREKLDEVQYSLGILKFDIYYYKSYNSMLIDEIREKDETIKKLNDLLYEKEKRICNMKTLLKY